MDEKTMDYLKNVLEDTLEHDFKKFYLKGFTAGYKACYHTTYKNIVNMTSAKQIKEYIKKEAEKIKIE